jgi:sigma-B regulation protein RsbU (phosphoserine phosphatase)
MTTIEQTYLRVELERRRERLQLAIPSSVENAELSQLLRQVDEALARIDRGTFGICESCHDPIETHRLLSDPLIRFCLDHLTGSERRALEDDLELAGQIQRGLLPKRHVHAAGWEARYHYEALGLVSGDYCDLIETPGVALNFFLGDVAGKGVAASMLMSHLHATFRTLISLNLAPEKMIEAANRLFCESTLAGQYATLVYGRAGAGGELDLVSAGHCPVLLVRDGNVERFNATGMPLGVMSGSSYQTQRTRLSRGDYIILYSDGLSESLDPAGEEYGVERLANLAREHCGGQPDAFIARCLADMRQFSLGTKQHDDLSILTISRNPGINAVV